MSNQKKVLIIANLFRASPRIPGLARYFEDLEWQPVFLTVPIGENPSSRFGPPDDFSDNFKVIETHDFVSRPELGARIKDKINLTSGKAYSYMRPFLSFSHRVYRDIAYYPDKEKRWAPYALKAAKDYLQREHVDLIISSSSPVTTHIVARELKLVFKIPWIADLRDLWSQNHNYGYGFIRKLFDRRLELNTLSCADALVTVTPFWAAVLRNLYKGKPVYTVSNGFDSQMNIAKDIRISPKFTITYTGQVLYRERQNPSKILFAIRDLIQEGALDRKDIEIRFFNPFEDAIEHEISKNDLSDIARQYGQVSRERSYEKQRESQLLLALNWEGAKGKGCIPSKIFEYLGAQRPIIATGGLGNDAVADLLEKTGAGEYCSSVEHIKEFIRKSYAEFKNNGIVGYGGDFKEISKYSYPELARNYVSVMNSVSGHIV